MAMKDLRIYKDTVVVKFYRVSNNCQAQEFYIHHFTLILMTTLPARLIPIFHIRLPRLREIKYLVRSYS